MTTTHRLDLPDGQIAYDLVGEGPLVVMSPGLGDTRASYRFLAPLLAEAGYRVASVDLRGHGDSSVGWPTYTRADTTADLVALIRELGGPAVVVGQSFAGGSATIAAANHPDLVSAVVEIGPFTRPPRFELGAFLRNDHGYRTGTLRLARTLLTGSPRAWSRYLDVAYPGRKPADWDTWLAGVEARLREPGRMAATRAMMRATASDAAAALPEVQRPVLVVMGTADPDFADPEGEARGIVEALPGGIGQVAMIEGAGHYPHAEEPEQVAAAVIPFLAEHHRA